MICILQIGLDGNIHTSAPNISGQINIGECLAWLSLAFALDSNFSKSVMSNTVQVMSSTLILSQFSILVEGVVVNLFVLKRDACISK